MDRSGHYGEQWIIEMDLTYTGQLRMAKLGSCLASREKMVFSDLDTKTAQLLLQFARCRCRVVCQEEIFLVIPVQEFDQFLGAGEQFCTLERSVSEKIVLNTHTLVRTYVINNAIHINDVALLLTDRIQAFVVNDRVSQQRPILLDRSRVGSAQASTARATCIRV